MNAPMYKKLKLDKQKHQCPYCGGFNCVPHVDYDTHVMACYDCDSTWHEYEDYWCDVFHTGEIIK